MKIAFTSCCDPQNDKNQAAWPEMAMQKPDVLVLLGDNIYMDYGLGENEYGLGEPSTLTPAVFASKMYANYARQWAVPNFHQAIQQIPKIFTIWDDHDFAWNNARGEGTVCTCLPAKKCRCEYVAPIYREISRTLFEQFRKALAQKPLANDYLPNPYLTGIPTTLTNLPYTGIQQTILDLLPDVQLHLLDGRSFRPERDKTKSFLGDAQQKALQNQLLKSGGIHLIASGTVLEDWKKYNDKKWLNSIAENANIIVLSGDIHEPAFYHRHRIFEFTASAMAQPAKITSIFGKESNVFGILEIFDKTIVTNIYQWDIKKQKLLARKSAEIDRKNWLLTGISEKSNEYLDY
jgi:alkaline phosphatase D